MCQCRFVCRTYKSTVFNLRFILSLSRGQNSSSYKLYIQTNTFLSFIFLCKKFPSKNWIRNSFLRMFSCYFVSGSFICTMFLNSSVVFIMLLENVRRLEKCRLRSQKIRAFLSNIIPRSRDAFSRESSKSTASFIV